MLDQIFQNPPAICRGTDFWMLNDSLDELEMRRQLRSMHEQGIACVIVRTYIGLRSDYPGRDWMEKMRAVVDEARSLGMTLFMQAGYMPEAVLDLPPEFSLGDVRCYPAGHGEGTVLERYPLGKVPADVVIPDGITGVGDVAFACCETMTSLSLPDSLKSIGIAAFSDCPGLKSVVIPDGVTELADFVFNSCTNLAEVTLPSKLESIGFATFAATAISEVTLPETVKTIGNQAYAQTNLAEILLPKSVEEIGEKAFGYTLDENGELHMNTEFVIGGELGTGAEQYARSGGENRAFEFVNTGASAEEIEATEKKNSAIRVIGIIACVLLLIAIAVFAYITGKNQKNTEKEQPAETPDEADGTEEEPEPAEAEAFAADEDAEAEEESGDE